MFVSQRRRACINEAQKLCDDDGPQALPIAPLASTDYIEYRLLSLLFFFFHFFNYTRFCVYSNRLDCFMAFKPRPPEQRQPG